MTKEAFRAFCDEWKGKGAKDFTHKSHYEDMMALFEAHAEVVELTEEDFHNLGTEGGVTTFYPKKETTDKIGRAAGLSFKSVQVGTRKESKYCYVGKAQTEIRGPDGQIISMSPGEYEYDAEVRAEVDILKNMAKYGNGSKFVGEKGEIEKKLCVARHQLVGRRRADTGARVAAIIMAIGMPTGFKNLFSGNVKKVYFLFSRIIYNAKNKMVMDKALETMGGAVKQLTGETVESFEDSGAIDPIVGDDSIDGDFEVTEQSDISDDDVAASEAFDGPVHKISIKEGLFTALTDFRKKHDGSLPQNGKDLIDAELSKGLEKSSESNLKVLLGRGEKTLRERGIEL